MKILHLITSLDKGGAESHLFDLSVIQKDSNNQVHIIYFKGNSYWREKLHANGVSTTFLPISGVFTPLKFLRSLLKILFLINYFKPNILHCHLSLAEIMGIILKFIIADKFKLVISKHLDSFIFEGSKGKRGLLRGTLLEKIIFSKADHIMCISKQVKKYFKNKINVNEAKISVVYYGVKYPKLKKISRIKKKYKLKSKNIYICNVARHVKQKNLIFLINSFKKLYEKSKKKNIFLILVGNGPETIHLQNHSKSIKIHKQIIWINFCEEIRELISISDIFCLTSDYEGLGLVLLEAMSVKTPIVAADTSAIPEVVENKKSALLFKRGDEDNFIKSIEILLKNKNFKSKIQINADKRLNKKFNLEEMYKKTNKIYKKISNK